jgi:ATP-binding cassette subfamily B protein
MGGRAIEKARNPKGALMRLLRYLRPFRLQLSVVVVLVVISTLLSLIGPYLIGVAIDGFIATHDALGLLRISLLMLGIYVAGTIASMAAGRIMVSTAQRALRNLRKALFERLQTLPLSFFDKRPTGELMSRLTNDIDAINTALTQNVTQLISSLLLSAGIIVMMFRINIWLALGSLTIFPIMVGLTALVSKRTRTGFRSLQMNLGRLNANMEENVSGERVVIAFGQQEAVLESFDEINNAVRRSAIQALTYALLIPPLMGILSNANIAVVAGLGGWLVLNGLASVGTIATFISYSRQFAQPLRMISDIYNNIQSALAGSERVFETIDEQSEYEDISDKVPLERIKGEVVFDHVDFEYVPGVPVLKDVSFQAKPGQTIALVGPTGAGKTTIINVFSRFYDIQNGKITIDGVDIRKIDKDVLRKQLGVVLQDVMLFSGTVLDNIRYGRLDATDEECREAAKLADADAFISRLPQGYMTQLSERGGNLSQGQRQLLSIARAALANPSILILDEATSSVDTRTERMIQAALLRLMKGRTSFVIAHRLSTIRNADQILVINEGRIIERGTHKELLQRRGFYYNLYMEQFRGKYKAEENLPTPESLISLTEGRSNPERILT